MGVDSRVHEFWAQTRAFGLAVAVHIIMAAIVVLGTMNWRSFRPPVLTGMTIEAVMVDTKALKQRRQQAAREALLAEQRKAAKARRAKALTERQEREKREAEAEKIRQQQRAQKKRDEYLRLKKFRNKQEQERAARDQKRRDAIDRLRKQRQAAARESKLQEEKMKQIEARNQTEAANRRQAVAEAEMRTKMAAEARTQKRASLSAQYQAVIQAQVTNNWLRPPTARSGLRCILKIVQIPGGEVISAAISGACNGDQATRRSLVAAVERAGSLPYQGFEDVFEREIDFLFKYDGD